MGDVAKTYWDGRFGTPGLEGVEHHSRQNAQITQDFLTQIMNRDIWSMFQKSSAVLEVGCGTGELLGAIHPALKCMASGVDISDAAIVRARNSFPGIHWTAMDVMSPGALKMLGPFDICICSNVIEHFREPAVLVDRLFESARRVCILAPYNQQVMDGYDEEGGAGHVSTITLDTFVSWHIVDQFTFFSHGWVHKAEGDPDPLQLCVILEK